MKGLRVAGPGSTSGTCPVALVTRMALPAGWAPHDQEPRAHGDTPSPAPRAWAHFPLGDDLHFRRPSSQSCFSLDLGEAFLVPPVPWGCPPR